MIHSCYSAISSNIGINLHDCRRNIHKAIDSYTIDFTRQIYDILHLYIHDPEEVELNNVAKYITSHDRHRRQ